MLKDHSQLQLSLSPYQGLYDAIIPEDHLLRRIKENIDFSFVNPMLRKQYCENFGRPAKEPEMMFKLLFLKKLYDLSDEALISSAQTDMAYKFFLNLEPEAKMIDSSLLTKFRKTRITEDILEELLKETIQQALDKNLIKSGTIIVDSTHTLASVRAKSPTQILRDMSKQLRKEIYKTAFELSEQFPEKPSLEAGLDEEIAYTKELLRILEEGIESCGNKKIQKLSREMKELLEDERLKEIRSKEDKDARFGHKTATSTFYGYKNHLAMTEERLIAGLSVTDGGAPDGQELPKLIEKAKENGIHTTLDTSGNPFTREEPFFSKFNELMQYTDLILLDIKHIDEKEHIRLTGHTNKNILDLATYLSDMKKPVWIRHVLVPKRNDKDEYLDRLHEFILTLHNVERVEVLPYHTLGAYKWKELGMEYPLEGIDPPTAERVENARKRLGAF